MTNTSALTRLLNYLSPHRKKVWLASFCSVANKFFDVMPEILIGIAIDVVVSQKNSWLAKLGFVSASEQLIALASATLLIWVCESIFEYSYSILWRNLAQTVQHELRYSTYKHVQTLDLAYFENRTTGGLVSIINDDINQLERFLDGGANSLIQVFTSVLLIGAVFFAIEPQIALIAMAPIPLILVGAFYYQKRAQPLYAQVRDQASLLGARLSSNLTGMSTIQSFTAEAREAELLKKESTAYCAANAKAIAVSSAFIPLIRMAIMVGFIATLVVGGHKALDGTLSVGSFGILVFLTQRLLWPLTGLAQTVDSYERAMASANRALDILSAQAHVKSGKTTPLKPLKGRVEIKNLGFSYFDGYPVLSNLNLTIEAGQTVAFVGATGSGKSTLAKLILRFYDPREGSICFDGLDSRDLDLNWLRQNIGLVSQDVFLFQGTVRDNIGYGLPSASFQDIEAAARVAEAHEFILSLPQGYDTWIGERGQKLSGGQRQRLSLARAVLKDPPIMILDEATSSVDNETEAAIQRSLEKIVVGRTTIVIAHRLSTVVGADQIFVLENGTITASGKSAELVSQGGLYARLWNVQTGLSQSST